MKKHSAFSLIELSIVILIIGILIAGVTQSSRIVRQARLSSARTATESSPVGSIKNLVSWYETTSEKSFDDLEAGINLSVTNWYDLTPQSSTKNNASQSTASNKATYKIEPSSNLPMLYFDGSGGNSTADYYSLPNSTFPIGNSAYTAFLVIRLSGDSTIVGAGPDGGADAYNVFGNVGTQIINSWWSANDFNSVSGAITLNNVQVASFIYDSSALTKKIYINGTAVNVYGTSNSSLTVTARNGSALYNYIGCSNASLNGAHSGNWFMNGYIGEYIIFDRALKNEERQAVERYLGKKWSVVVA